MSIKELDRGKVLGHVHSKQISKIEAARRLGITRQHVDRLYQRFCKEGDEGLISKRRGRCSNNRIPDSVRAAVIKIIREKYYDFKPGFAHEKLTEEHGFKLSDETVRQIMTQAGIWQGKKRKHAKVHQMRTRRSARGELIQLDGSPHDWFEGRRGPCCLLVLIDDASSEIMGLRFVENECLQGYFDLIREYIERCGRPLAFYSDKHSIFHVNIKEAASGTGETQLGRVARTLDIELIPANSPQAKGRVERANQTFQDRLIKEMRLSGINDIQTANPWLPGFIKKHNRRFAVEPATPLDAHRKAIPKSAELDHIFSLQAQRKLSKNLEISYNNVIYQIQTKSPGYTMRGACLTVCESPNQVILLYKNKSLPYKTFDKNNRPGQALDSKNINAHIDKRTIGRKPKPDHPWYSGLAS